MDKNPQGEDRRRSRYIRLFVVYSVIFYFIACGKADNQNSSSIVSGNGYNYSLKNMTITINAPRELLINHSVNVSVELTPEIIGYKTDDFQYQWSATAGEIIGEGVNAFYTAPGDENTVFINVTISDSHGESVSRSAIIFIHKQFIIIKADDLGDILRPAWQNFITYLEDNGIKASIGVIAKYLTFSSEEWFEEVKRLIVKGDIEFWCHGYDHSSGTDVDGKPYYEFSHTPYEQQIDHLLKCINLSVKKLNYSFKTFGAPYDATDSNTIKALEDIDTIKVWLLGSEISNKLVLKNRIYVENYPHPSYEKFINQYNKDDLYIVLPFHPGGWNNDDLKEFKKIIGYLMEHNVKFVTPYKYYELLCLE